MGRSVDDSGLHPNGRPHFFLEEGIMLEVSKSATEAIADYFQGKKPVPIRIFLNEGG